MQRGPSRIDADEVLMSDGCRQIISDNGFDDKITLIHGKVEDVDLPVPKVTPTPAQHRGGAHFAHHALAHLVCTELDEMMHTEEMSGMQTLITLRAAERQWLLGHEGLG